MINPLRTVDVYSRSLRDATGPVDMYSRIPTSTQVTCIAAFRQVRNELIIQLHVVQLARLNNMG